MAIEFDHGASTHRGSVRAVQEDAFTVASPVFAVADGMGGHSGGGVASRIAVDELSRLGGRRFTATSARQAVSVALLRAQSRLGSYADLQASDRRRWHGGTTVVVAVLVEGDGAHRWLVAHVGDSRAYAVGERGPIQVTRDHSVVQELVDAGELTGDEAAVHAERHVVTRALSSRAMPVPDFVELGLDQAPRLMLCTDGVSGPVDSTTLASSLDATHPPQEAAQMLVQSALSAGGTDNATALVVDVMGWRGSVTRMAGEHDGSGRGRGS